ncbi:hypothetical protein I552_0417, partial [Mycobacterium xenopi 3993]
TSLNSWLTSVVAPAAAPTPRRRRHGCRAPDFPVLHDHGGAADPTQTHRAGSLYRARGGFPPAKISISVVFPEPLAP